MLTKDLLRYKISGDYAKLQFISAQDPWLLSLASSLITLFENAVSSCTREDLEEQLFPLVNASQDVILTKSLVKLLMDRSLFSGKSTREEQDPGALRHALFLKSMELLDSEECPEDPLAFREKVWACFPQQSDRILYNDLPEYETLLRVKKIYPQELLERYNVSLVQSMILYAGEMVCTLPAEDPALLRRFFKYLKFFRLLFRAELKKRKDGSSVIQLHIDGPASILEHSIRYGLLLANFFPAICVFPRWKMSCELKIRSRSIRLALDESAPLAWSYSNFGAYIPEEFRLFREYFMQKQTGSAWEMIPREGFLSLEGNKIAFPDFAFRHKESALEVDVELFHPWHRNELSSRIAYLETHPETALILGADRSCLKKDESLLERFSRREGNFLFSSFPGVENVIRSLERYRKTFEKAEKKRSKRKRGDRLRKNS